MALPTITAADRPEVLAGQIVETAQQRSFNLGRDLYSAPVNIPLAFIDTTISSLANITDAVGVTDFNLSDGIMPSDWGTYQRNRPAWSATADIAGLFVIAGAASKAIRAGGAIENTLQRAGMSAEVTARVVSQRGRIAAIEKEFATLAGNSGQILGANRLTAPGITDVAVPWASLGGAVKTADEARAAALRLRVGASVRETVSSEVAIAALMNDSEFLFPPDMSLSTYLMTAGMVGGAFTLIDRAVGAAGFRRALAQAAKANSTVASAARGTELSRAQTSRVVGDRWTVLGTSANELNAADNQLKELAGAGLDEATARTVQVGAQRVRQEAQRDAVVTSRQIFADVTLPKVAKPHVPTEGQLENTIAWTRADQKNAIGVQSFEDAGVIRRLDSETELAHTDLLAARIKGNTQEEAAARARLAELDEMSAGVIEADGATNMHTARQTPWQEAVPTGKTTLRRDRPRESFALQDKNAPKLSLTRNGQVTRGVGRSNNYVGDMGELSFQEVTSLYKAVGVGADDLGDRGFAAAFGQNFDGAVESLPYPVLDAIQSGRLGENFGMANQTNMVALSGARESGAVAREAFFQKFGAFSRAQEEGVENAFDLSKRLNLQMHTTDGANSALFDVLEMVRQGGVTDLRTYFAGKSYDEVIDALAGLASGQAGGDALDAMRKHLKSALGDSGMLSLHQKEAPVGFVRKILDGASDTDANYAKIGAATQQVRLADIARSENSYVGAVREAMTEMPNVVEGLSDVAAITRDGLIESRGIGAAAARQVTQTTNRFRNIAAIQFANTFQAVIKRKFDKITQGILQPVADAHNALLKAKRYDVLAQHSDYTSTFRIGAELAEDYLKPGLNALNKDSHRVQQMVQRVFGKNVDELVGDLDLHVFDKAAALRGEYRPLEFTEDGVGFINQTINASYEQLKLRNEIARIMRTPEVNRVAGHVPLANFRNLEMRYLADETGKIVGHVNAKTAAEANRLQADAMRAARERGETLIGASEGQIKGWVESADQVRFAQLADFGDPLLQTGATKGKNLDVTRDVSGDLGVSQLIALRESFDQLGKDAMYAAFESTILKNRNLMRIGNASATGQTQGVKGTGKGRAFFNANEEWENVFMGRSARPEGSVAANYENTTMAWLDDVIDSAAAAIFPTDGRGVGNAARRKLGNKQQQAAIDKIVADYDPMGAAAEAVARTKTLSSPDARILASTLQAANKVTGEVFLKFMNIAHPLLNMLSVAVTTPAVAQQVTRRAGEALEDWQRRAGPWAEFMDGDAVATVSPTKLMSNGMQFFHSDAGAKVLAEAETHGFITANMLEELNGAIFKVPSKASEVAGAVRRYADILNGPVNWVAKKRGVDLSADTISERSETYVRGMFHAMGYDFIERTGQKGLTSLEKHSFANWFANQNIADYAPNIRGQALRGVAGIPLGLFQSFGINFLQRNFRYLENKDTRAVAVQAATQTAIFGAEGLPGWPVVNEYFMAGNERGGNADSTFTDRIYGAYGKEIGDVLLSGTISNMPRLFGAGDGVNLYTSGDTNPRIFEFTPPALSLATQSMQMVSEAMKAGIEDMRRVGGNSGEFDNNRIAEVLAAYMPSRGVRSLLELGLGYSADRAGDLVQEDTRSGIALFSRLLGTRTVDEVRQRQALYQNRVDLQHRSARLAQVGRAFTAAVRAQARQEGVEAADYQVPQDMFDAYIARWVGAGGRLDTARTAFNRMVVKAGTPETVRQMRQFVGKDGTLKGGDMYQFGVERLLQYGYGANDMPGAAEATGTAQGSGN